ncbi:MAG: ABC transporter substrate-binding protein [Thermodesulfobacteriota bacterium]
MKRSSVMMVLCMSLAALLFLAPGMVAAQSVKTLKVGSVLPLNFGMGVDTKNALEMLAAELNAAGGITVKGQRYNVELIVYDDKWSAEAGRAAVERLVHDDKVRFLISTISSATILSGAALFEQEKVLNIFGGSTLKALDPKLKYSFGGTTVRTSTPPVWTAVQQMWPKAKTVVFLAPNDEGGKTRASEEKRVAEAFGVKVLDTLFYPRTATDFTPLAVKAASYKPDLVDYPGADTGTQLGLQIKEVYAAGFRGGQISAINPKWPEIKSVAPIEAIEGMVAKMPDTELPNPPAHAKAFKDAWVKKFGKWSDASLPWIPPWFALIAAIKKADSVDPTEIAEMIGEKGVEWMRIDGKAMFVKRPDLNKMRYCDSIAEAQYGQIRKGGPVPIKRLGLPEVIAACERVFGGNWK